MKKNGIIFCVVLTVFSLSAFGFMNGNDSETDSVETSVNENLTITKAVRGKINKTNFSGFIYDVGPSQLENGHRIPYLAVDPVKQAEYKGGKEALMEYLKENSENARAGQLMDKLQPFKLLFTVTKNGTIENVRLDGTSGYIAIDVTMMFLVTKAHGKWEPAEDSKGEKVDQELVVSFGLTGC
ncbi:MAG: hypothetical protein AAFX53_18580 [Bacteroidota bacterium]